MPLPGPGRHFYFTISKERSAIMSINHVNESGKPPEPERRLLDDRWNGRSTFTVVEAGCDILGLSRSTAYASVRTGALPVIWIGRRCVVPRHALEKLLEGRG
jgi:excisionase family DNA binding protein